MKASREYLNTWLWILASFTSPHKWLSLVQKYLLIGTIREDLWEWTISGHVPICMDMGQNTTFHSPSEIQRIQSQIDNDG